MTSTVTRRRSSSADLPPLARVLFTLQAGTLGALACLALVGPCEPAVWTGLATLLAVTTTLVVAGCWTGHAGLKRLAALQGLVGGAATLVGMALINTLDIQPSAGSPSLFLLGLALACASLRTGVRRRL